MVSSWYAPFAVEQSVNHCIDASGLYSYRIVKVLITASVVQVLNSRVTSVDPNSVCIVDKEGRESEIPFGACVWATGVAMNPLVKLLQSKVAGQDHFRSLVTDDYLRVVGSHGSIWALGDASTIAMPKALDYADELFTQADTDKSDTLSLAELQVLYRCSTLISPSFFPKYRLVHPEQYLFILCFKKKWMKVSKKCFI